MSKKSKVVKVGDFREGNTKYGLVYYVDIEFENGDKGNIGVKDKAKMHVGKEFDYDISQDEQGRYKIKAVQPFPVKAMSSFNDKTGMMVGAALNSACLLAAHSIINISEVESTARTICQISIKLKEEFKDK